MFRSTYSPFWWAHLVETWYIRYMDHGGGGGVQIKNSSNLHHHVRRGYINDNLDETLLPAKFFNMHSICVNYMFETCYSVFKINTKYFSIDCGNITCYTCFQFRNNLCFLHRHGLSGISTIRITGFKSRKQGDQPVGKILEITRSSPNLIRSSTVTGRAI